MIKRHRLSRFVLILALATCSAAASVVHPNTNDSKTIWQDRGDISALNLFYGEGGEERAPDPDGSFTFVKEDMSGTSPKFDVEDVHGVRWRVKLGIESQSEVAATRLVWAAGYFVDEDYYLPEIKVEKLRSLKRGNQFVTPGGAIEGARLERRIKGEKNIARWDWFSNPFSGERTLNGLKVMMALINDWDLKDVNNEIRENHGELEYAVTDWGASFGRTGNSSTRSKSDPVDYSESKFIQQVTPAFVDFVMHSRPRFWTIVDVSYYRERSRMSHITKNIPREHAKWIGEELSRLSENQIRDCFRAAGYAPAQVGEYTMAVQGRIAQLKGL